MDILKRADGATPIWLMRQAGRYQKIYRNLRSKHGLLELVKDPALACEVTMQPLNSFDLDAGIIFSDILPLLEGMGFDLEFLPGEGPKIHNPSQTRDDIQQLREISAAESMGFTLEAIRLVRKELSGRNIPLIGFSGSPFTLASYAIEGGPSKNYIKTKKMMHGDPESFHLLMSKIASRIVDYLMAQREAGAQMLQLFDSWAGALSPTDYVQHVKPHVVGIIRSLGHSQSPLLYFSTGTSGYLNHISDLDCDGFGVDWRVDIRDAAKQIPAEKILQGNLDPVALFAPWDILKLKAKNLLDDIDVIRPNRENYIFNLGHGILPETPEDNVKRLVDFVHEYTAR